MSGTETNEGAEAAADAGRPAELLAAETVIEELGGDAAAAPLDTRSLARWEVEDLSAEERAVRDEVRRLFREALGRDPLFDPTAELVIQQEREVGQGGMGVVYLVTDRRLGRRAAMKILHAQSTERRRRRFRREAEITARLDHPGVPPVYGFGRTVSGQQFLLMRYVEGEALDAILARRGRPDARPLAEIVAALVRVAEAVAYAHSRGVVHRDIKPANVMLGAYGEVLLMDWGLARDLRESSGEDRAVSEQVLRPSLDAGSDSQRLTREGAILGTLGYLPPEQVADSEVGPPADVFALGALLCEVLSGAPPLQGKTQREVIERTRRGEVVLPSARDPGVPRELDAVARRALAADPSARYPDAEAFARDLRAWLEGREVSACAYSSWERAALAVRRRPALTAATAVAAALSLVALVAVAWTRSAAVVAERRALVGEAQQATAAAMGELEGAPLPEDLEARSADERERLLEARTARALSALSAAQRWHAVAPKERAAAEARFAAAFALARVAELAEQWPLAARAYGEAQGLGVDDDRARTAAREAASRAVERGQRARDEDLARRYAEEGRARLDEGEYGQAQAALHKAIAFGSREAPDLLEEAGRRLLERRTRERMEQVQRAVARRAAEEARERVRAGRAALAAGRLEEARTAFLQALAFDGADEEASEGLLEADRALQERKRRAEAAAARERLRREAAEQRAVAGRELEDGRRLFRDGGREEEVREAYLSALSALDRVLFLDPELEAARAERATVAAELAAILREEGRYALADFVLRDAGLEAKDVLEVELPEDPHLVVTEAAKVQIRRAFGGSVRFEPSRVFLPLRDYLRDVDGGRYRAVIEVRSMVTRELPPKVFVTGLWIRLEDRVANTVSPVRKVDLDEPCRRPVRVGQEGRLVTAFEEALRLDPRPWVARVGEAIRALVAETRARHR